MGYAPAERKVDHLRGSLPKLKEKLMEALKAVLPIVGIVLALCFSAAPISPSILLCFLLGAAMIMAGMMFLPKSLLEAGSASSLTRNSRSFFQVNT